MLKKSKISVPPPDPYKFREPWKRKIMGWMEGLGGLLFRPTSFLIRWESLKKIAILRFDGLGDIVLTEPFLREIKNKHPRLQTDLWVGPWGKDTAGMIEGADRVMVLENTAWKRPHSRPWSWPTILKLGRLLRDEKYDVVIDLRGDLRHLIAMRLAGIPIRAGLTLTGGGVLLTHPLYFDPALHVIGQNLYSLSQMGLAVDYKNPPFPRLKPDEKLMESVGEKCRGLGIGQKIIAIHPVCEVPSRKWIGENWVSLISRMGPEYDLVLVGGQGDRNELEELQKNCGRKVFVSAGLFTVQELSLFLRRCAVFIGLNSSPGHIAASVGTPVISLFSGTEPPDRWGPYGPKVSVIHKKTECWPCDLSVCPFENDCMRRISVEEVLGKMGEILGRKDA